MTPEDNRFESEPEAALEGEGEGLPFGWEVAAPDAESPNDVARLVELLRADEEHGRGWASSGADEVLVELGGTETRENVVIRDAAGVIQAWGSVHDRAGGRMLFIHLIARDLTEREVAACSDVLVVWAEGQAHVVGEARGMDVQQIDCGAFADDARQHRLLERAGFRHVRNWWQMKRQVAAEERDLVPSADEWEAEGVRFRVVRRGPDGLPDVEDLREVHEVLESAFVDHFNSHPETFSEFIHRLREEPGHAWDHWWLAESVEAIRWRSSAGGEGRATGVSRPASDLGGRVASASDLGGRVASASDLGGRVASASDLGGRVASASERIETPTPLGTLIGSAVAGKDGREGSYVEYLGVLDSARGRGVAKGLLHTAIADAALRGRPNIGLEVDADSPSGAQEMYRAMGWETSYVTQSWHRDVVVRC